MTTFDAALSYAARGWPVFPVAKDKRPLTPKGFYDASADAAQIRDWFTRFPNAGIGLRTGKPSGLLVVDVDAGSGGHESLAALEAEHGQLPATVESRTGGGGRHLLFAHPGGKVGNRAGIRRGIDIRASGGYIVVPPSDHPSGNRYAWVNAPGTMALATMPDWLLKLVRREKPAAQPLNASADVERAIAVCRKITLVDNSDGSKRLYTYCCRCREHGLSVAQTTIVIRQLDTEKPFPKSWTPAEIEARYDSAGEIVTHGAAVFSLRTAEDRTDASNAKRFTAMFGHDIRYCDAWGKWLIFNGSFWEEDATCD